MSQDFFVLTPDSILDEVEKVLPNNSRATGRTWILNSIENRVYEIEFEDQSRFVGKFYRPERWSAEQILEEHSFVKLLAEHEIPAVAPLELEKSPWPTLAKTKSGIYFALFPKVQGRSLPELNNEELRVLGHFLGRMHRVALSFQSHKRIKLNAENFGEKPLAFLLESQFVNETLKPRLENVVKPMIKLAREKLSTHTIQSIHGDCHLGNILWKNGEAIFLDFDDMLVGPKVQDLWMIVNGRDQEDLRRRDIMIEAYQNFSDFDWSEFKIVEVLRALRILHYAAWIARRWSDPSFPQIFLNFGSDKYWFEEIQALEECMENF
jgi:Ser/Thr protein kinase RdoA (MazF antagonist)